MSWQKYARFGIATFVIVFVAIVAVTLRQRKPALAEAPAPKRVDPAAVVENVGTGRIERSEAGKIVLTLKFGTQFTYADGRSKLGGGVEVSSDRNGRPFTVTSREAEIAFKGEAMETAHFTGSVKLKSAGTEVATEDASYNSAEGLVTIPGAVAFTRGRMNGAGVGATYDFNREVLWILDKANIKAAPDAKGQGGLEATSGAAGLARQEHYIRLSRDGHIVAHGRVIDADEITIQLTEDEQRVQTLQLRGNSRMTGGSGTGAPQAMSARDIDLLYGEDGRTLQNAQLMENAVVQLPGDGRSGGRRITGKAVVIALSPDGATVTNLNATENVQVDLPAQGDLPAKRIRSTTLMAIGAPGTGLQNATFTGNVEYRETRAARGTLTAVDRTARSHKLIVDTTPGLGAVQKADFYGNVRFTDGQQVVADAPRGLYHLDRDQIDLSPGDGDPGQGPRVSDGKITVDARTISFALGTRKLVADTRVRSSMKTAAPGPGASSPQARVPSLLKQDQPVTITSNRLDYDGAAGQARYDGNAKLWQNDTSIRSDAISLDDTTGNLEARGAVRTEMMLDEVDAKTGARKRTPTKGQSETFVYDDAKRTAVYTTSARLEGPQGDLTAERVELFLKAGTNELERVEAYGANGAVILKEGTRTATGARLTYTARTETYLMSGTPVVAIDKTPPDCKRSEGTVLTFRRGVMDSMSTEGNGVFPSKQQTFTCTTETR